MNLLFHLFSKKSAAGRWWLGLILAAALAFPGCKQLGLNDDGPHDDGLRRNDMALPAREARAKESWPAEKKPADDPLMSDEAQRVYHDLD
ncbi:MAG: hypothetical protein WCB27_26220 [Thermoguttaceae bacterium]|jgi:hypothetical protein